MSMGCPSAVVVCAALLVAAGAAEAQTREPQAQPLSDAKPQQQSDPQQTQSQSDPQPQSDPQQSSRPYEGLFAQSRVPTAQTLTFMVTAGGGYDTNILAGGAAGPGAGPGAGLAIALPVGPSQPSTFENGSASLAYSFAGRRLSFGATASTNANYYASFGAEPLTVSDSGNINTAWNVSSRTAVTASVTAGYGPFYTLPGVPVVPVAPDSAGQTDPANQTPGQTLVLDSGSTLLVEDHLSLLGGVGLTHSVTRRLSFSLNYSDSVVTSPSHEFDLSAKSYGGGFSYLLAQGLSAQLLYNESTGRFGVGQTPTTSRGLNGGLAFNRTLSITRRTVVTFASGLSAFSNATILNGRAQYFLSVQASLVREIGRTWTATVAYNRSASFVETFLQPVFSDALTAGIGGRLSRRVQVQSSMGATDGTVGLLGSSANHFRSYFGSAGLRVDASQTVSVGLDYSYYRSRFASGVELPAGFPAQSGVQSVRVYMSLWAPLMSRGRRPNAAR
jgi:hypothetical protein